MSKKTVGERCPHIVLKGTALNIDKLFDQMQALSDAVSTMDADSPQDLVNSITVLQERTEMLLEQIDMLNFAKRQWENTYPDDFDNVVPLKRTQTGNP